MAQKTYGIDFGTDTIKIYKKGQGIILLEKMWCLPSEKKDVLLR